MNIEELYKKMKNNVNGIVIIKDNKLIWTLPNNVEFEVSCNAYQNEGYIELNYYRNNKKINVTHFHPMDDEIYNELNFFDKNVIWYKKKGIFNFDRPIWWIEKEKFDKLSERKKAKYIII